MMLFRNYDFLFHFLNSLLNIGSSKDVSEIRVSKNTWIEDGESDLVDKVSLRINRITGLQTIRKYDEFNEGKKEEYEFFQVMQLVQKRFMINSIYRIILSYMISLCFCFQ